MIKNGKKKKVIVRCRKTDVCLSDPLPTTNFVLKKKKMHQAPVALLGLQLSMLAFIEYGYLQLLLNMENKEMTVDRKGSKPAMYRKLHKTLFSLFNGIPAPMIGK